MLVVGIGDLLIPEKVLVEKLKVFEKLGHTVKTLQWELKDYEELQNINLKIETQGSEAYQAEDGILNEITDAEILITQFFPVTKKVIKACPNLKIIGVLRGGYENINVQEATNHGIKVFNTPGRNATAVADFTVGMLLAECRNIAKGHLNLKDGKWVRDYDNAAYVPDLSEKTVGIIGFGAIGKKVAQRLQGFEMNILAYDPYVKEAPEYVKLVDLDTLLKESMVVTLHMRLTNETHHIINKDKLVLMSEQSYFINTARSGLVNEEDLYEVLKEKKIQGAALDVFDKEPPEKDYPLVTLPNVTITPHLAGGTSDAFLNSPKQLANEILGYLNNNETKFIVNK